MLKKLIFVLSLAVVFGGGMYHVLAEEQTLPAPIGEPTTSPKPAPMMMPPIKPTGDQKLTTEQKAALEKAKIEEIKKLQGFLINQHALKIDGEPTGTTGPKTKEAIKKLQRVFGLPPTGTLGPLTKAKLKEILSAQEKSPDAKALEKSDTTDNDNNQREVPNPILPLKNIQPEKIIIKTDKGASFVLPNTKIPRIMILKDKGVFHMNTEKGIWESDPSDTVPTNIEGPDRLKYCLADYPKTVGVAPYMFESLTSSTDTATMKPNSLTNMSFRCIQSGEHVIPVDPEEASDATTSPHHLPRVMFSAEKPNLHVNSETGKWEADSAGVNAAAVNDKLAYCKTFYPSTTSVVPFGYEKIPGQTVMKLSYRCVQEGESETELPKGSVLGISTSAEQLKAETNSASGYKFTKPLPLNIKGDDVKKLQKILSDNCYLENGATGTMDSATVSALKDFQEDNDIEMTGTFGPKTRAQINQITGTPGQCINASLPKIVVKKPNGGEVYTEGQQILVKWKTKRIPASSQAGAALKIYDNNNVELGSIGLTANTLPTNTGHVSVTLPTMTTIHSYPVYANANYGRHYKVVVSSYDIATGVVDDISDSMFSINPSGTTCPAATPSITVTSPNGGEVYQAGQQVTITWTSCNIVGNIGEINLVSPMNNWVGSLEHYVPNNGTITLTLPSAGDLFTSGQNTNSLFGQKFKIEIKGLNGTNIISDSSNNLFSINSSVPLPPTPIGITLNSPNGGQTYTGGQQITVNWSTLNAPANELIGVSLQHVVVDSTGAYTQAPADINGSPVFTLTGGTANDGSETFTLPNLQQSQYGNKYDITVWWWDTTNYSFAFGANDSSNSYFTINPNVTTNCPVSGQSITVTSPNGGEVYQDGQQVTVTWTSCNIPASTLLEVNIFSNSGLVFGFMAPNGTPNDGSQTFTFGPGWPNGSTYKIIVGTPGTPGEFNNSSLGIRDESNAPFTMQGNTPPTISITSPNTSPVTWNPGVHTVNWQTTGTLGSVGITFCFISTINDCSGTVLDQNTTTTVASAGTAQVVVTNPYPGDEQSVMGKIRVFSLGNPQIYDESDAYVTIVTSGFPG